MSYKDQATFRAKPSQGRVDMSLTIRKYGPKRDILKINITYYGALGMPCHIAEIEIPYQDFWKMIKEMGLEEA